MADDREKISTGPNEEPINETIAGTGPGIPDDALAPGEDLAPPPSDEEVEKAAKVLEAPVGEHDTLPLEGECLTCAFNGRFRNRSVLLTIFGAVTILRSL